MDWSFSVIEKVLFQCYGENFRYLLTSNCVLFSRKHTRASTADMGNIENEYIRNLQQQIYFLELEANYLYPFQ